MRTATRALALPAIALLALGLTACGGSKTESASTDSTSADAPAAVETAAEETSVLKLEVGNCVSDFGAVGTDAGTETTVQKVDVLDCNTPHLYEVFHNEDLTDATYPEGETMTDKATQLCSDAFTSFVGIPYDTSSYGITFLNPTADSWEQGDRTVTCMITSADDTDLTGSAQGTNK